MKRRTSMLVLFASLALAACGGNNDNNTNTNNDNNGETNNGTTATNNGTTATNNGTTATNNTTGGTNNNTGGTNNNTNNNTIPPSTCDTYCDTVMANCTGPDAQYANRDACIDYCQNVAGWEAGEGGATDGNSISCREYHGGDPAAADPVTHCPHAGPTGGNVCGTWCDNYCEIALNNCTDGNALYADDAECQTACAGFNDTGAAGDVEYDTVQCRIYHAGAPAASDPATHCPHAAAEPTAICLGLPTDFNFRDDAPDAYTRVDRMGMPAVSTALVTNKEAYNDADPDDDLAQTFVADIVANIGALHTALDDDLTGLNLTPCATIGTPSCVSQTVGPNGPTVASLIIPDTIKINTAADAGFPNGRRLVDPVMDVTLAVILLDLEVHTALDLVGTNPTANDLGVEGAFLTTFPYLHPPHQ